MKRQCEASLFATDDQLRAYRGFTAFLGHLESELFDGVLGRERGSTNKTSKIASDQEKGKYVDFFEHHQRTHVHLVTRGGVDVVALQVSGKLGGLEGGKFTIIHDQHVIIAENTVNGDLKEDQSAEYPFKVFLRANVEPDQDLPEDLSKTRAIVEHVVGMLRDAKTAGYTNVLFVDHIAIYTNLLRQLRKAETNDVRKQRASSLETYVFLTCCSKMTTRLDMGKYKGSHKRNYHDLLTCEPTDLLETAVWERDDIDISKERLTAVPTGKLLALIEACLRSAQLGEHADAVATESIYGPQGRQRFHFVLSRLLKLASDSLSKLTKKMGRPTATTRNENPVEEERFMATVSDMVDNAKRDVLNLARFVKLSREGKDRSVLVTHLEWLNSVGSIEKTSKHLENLLGRQRPEGMPLPSGTDTDTRDRDQDGTDTHGATGDDVPAEGEIDNEDAELDQLTSGMDGLFTSKSVNRSGWGLGADKYLELVCLHATGLLGLTRFNAEKPSDKDKRMSEWITKSKIAVVDIQRGARRQDRATFDDCLDEMIRLDESLSRSKQRLREILGKEIPNRRLQGGERKVDYDCDRIMGRTDGYEGTYHCETILLTLMACRKNPKIAQGMTETWLERNGIFAAALDLLQFFDHAIPLVPVSKRSCPACTGVLEAVQQAMSDTELKRMLFPGNHPKWFTNSLPEWTPREVADLCLDYVKEELLKKLQKIRDQDQLLGNLIKSSSSEHTRIQGSGAESEEDESDDEWPDIPKSNDKKQSVLATITTQLRVAPRPSAQTSKAVHLGSEDMSQGSTGSGMELDQVDWSAHTKRKYDGDDEQERPRDEKYDGGNGGDSAAGSSASRQT